MKAPALMYHDVVDNGNYGASGFSGEGADVYKLDRQEFARHLEAIRQASGGGGVCLTFDDGGASAYDPIAAMLESHGWRGYFFVTTGRIGTPGFLQEEQIRDLDRRGHVVGSHSSSHPTRMAHISRERMLREWGESAERLAGLIGRPVTVASVPGGYYSREVAETAAAAGIQTLFTSEPTMRVETVRGCRVVGRYVIQRGMGPEWAAGFAARKVAPRMRQALLWQAKRVAKTLGGEAYLRMRETILKKA